MKGLDAITDRIIDAMYQGIRYSVYDDFGTTFFAYDDHDNGYYVLGDGVIEGTWKAYEDPYKLSPTEYRLCDITRCEIIRLTVEHRDPDTDEDLPLDESVRNQLQATLTEALYEFFCSTTISH